MASQSVSRIAQLLDQIDKLKSERARLRSALSMHEAGSFSSTAGPLFTFGAIADVQYCDIPDGSNFSGTVKRHFRGALDCLRSAVDEWCAAPAHCAPAFVAQLGDIIDNQCQENGQTAPDFAAVRGEFERLSCRTYHLSVAATSAANAAIHCPHASAPTTGTS